MYAEFVLVDSHKVDSSWRALRELRIEPNCSANTLRAIADFDRGPPPDRRSGPPPPMGRGGRPSFGFHSSPRNGPPPGGQWQSEP